MVGFSRFLVLGEISHIADPKSCFNNGIMGPEEDIVTDSGDDMQYEEEDEDVVELTPEQLAEAAEAKKSEGNQFYAAKSYNQAVQLYTQAIGLCPSCAAYYSNRAAAHMMLGDYDKALDDARRSTQIDPTSVKGYLRQAKCHLAMGQPVVAILSYNQALQLCPDNNTALAELESAQRVKQFCTRAEDCYNKGDHRTVLFCMDRCIELSPDCRKFKLIKAESLAMLKRYQEAQEIANDSLRLDRMNADAMYVRGLCLYYQDNPDKAFQHFQQVLKLAPDHVKAKTAYKKAKCLMQKKEEGNAAFRGGSLQEAYELYTAALHIDTENVFTNSKLYCNRATVCAKLGRSDDAITDCTAAIKLDETYTKAYMRRAKCYMETEQYQEAVRDYDKIYKMDKSRENKQLLSEAKLELKKSQRKDYYKVLGVSKTGTEEEIKKAYRKRALLHHPDRHSSASDDVRKAEEKKFKEVGEAYSVLSDPKKKSRYDSGQDLDDLEGPGGFHDMDANVIFQTFFSGGGPSFGGGGGGFQSPGGFSFQFG